MEHLRRCMRKYRYNPAYKPARGCSNYSERSLFEKRLDAMETMEKFASSQNREWATVDFRVKAYYVINLLYAFVMNMHLIETCIGFSTWRKSISISSTRWATKQTQELHENLRNKKTLVKPYFIDRITTFKHPLLYL